MSEKKICILNLIKFHSVRPDREEGLVHKKKDNEWNLVDFYKRVGAG